MSEYHVIQTEYIDRTLLLESLQAMEVKVETAADCENSLTLIGYRGDTRPEKAEIVIRRKNISAYSNDIGFARGANGAYTAIVSQYDQGLDRVKTLTTGLRKEYAYRKLVQQARLAGYAVKHETAPGGVIINKLVPLGARNPHEIQFDVSEEGIITTEVKGMKGPACGSVTRWLRAVGTMTDRGATNDFYKRATAQADVSLEERGGL